MDNVLCPVKDVNKIGRLIFIAQVRRCCWCAMHPRHWCQVNLWLYIFWKLVSETFNNNHLNPYTLARYCEIFHVTSSGPYKSIQNNWQPKRYLLECFLLGATLSMAVMTKSTSCIDTRPKVGLLIKLRFCGFIIRSINRIGCISNWISFRMRYWSSRSILSMSLTQPTHQMLHNGQ